MCPQGQWEKLTKGSWARSMSPFDHKLLDVRIVGSSSEILEVSLDEGLFVWINEQRNSHIYVIPYSDVYHSI